MITCVRKCGILSYYYLCQGDCAPTAHPCRQGLSVRKRREVRVFLFQKDLFSSVALQHSPQLGFRLNDGVEAQDIFEVFTLSVSFLGTPF